MEQQQETYRLFFCRIPVYHSDTNLLTFISGGDKTEFNETTSNEHLLILLHEKA